MSNINLQFTYNINNNHSYINYVNIQSKFQLYIHMRIVGSGIWNIIFLLLFSVSLICKEFAKFNLDQFSLVIHITHFFSALTSLFNFDPCFTFWEMTYHPFPLRQIERKKALTNHHMRLGPDPVRKESIELLSILL